MEVEEGDTFGRRGKRLQLIKWFFFFFLLFSKLFSLLAFPAPSGFLLVSCQASFINGSSWRSFSGIQGLLPFGILISSDAWNTVKTLLETITIQTGDQGSFQGPDGWIQPVPQDTKSRKIPVVTGLPWVLKVYCKVVNRTGFLCKQIMGASVHLSDPPWNCQIWVSDQPESLLY